MMMDEKKISQMRAIDIHSHLGQDHGQSPALQIENGSTEYLQRTMALANIGISINSSRYAISPRGFGYTIEGNRQLLKIIEKLPGVFGWVIIDPHEPESYLQAKELVNDPKILGLKIHPEEHEYDLMDFGDEIFSLAECLGVPVLGHSGGARSMPEAFCIFANRYPTVKIIAAHLGNSPDDNPNHHIHAIEQNLHGNLYTDTSSSMSLMANLLEYAVERIGSDRILFGTDSSYYFSPCQRLRVDEANIPHEDKKRILRDNALTLFPQLKYGEGNEACCDD